MLRNSNVPSSNTSGRSGQLPSSSRRSISALTAVLCSTRISCTLGMVVYAHTFVHVSDRLPGCSASISISTQDRWWIGSPAWTARR